MKLAFLVDPLDHLKAYKDSSVAMMREAHKRGHDVYAVRQGSLHWASGAPAGKQVRGEAVHLQLRPDDHDWYRETGRDLLPLTDFDALVMRKDPPFDMEYVTSTWLLERAEAEGLRVFNRPRALRDHSEKLSIAEFPEFIAPTLVSRELRRLHAFIDEHRDVVVKPLDGMGGTSVFRVHHFDANRNVILETITALETRTVMAQRYLPEIKEGDKRILLIGGQVVPWALARIPKAGETRGNLAAGGTGVAQPLSPRDRQIAETLAPVLAARGLFLVGLDVIGDWLTEINVTSPTCFVEIGQQTGFNVAAVFITALEKACRAH